MPPQKGPDRSAVHLSPAFTKEVLDLGSAQCRPPPCRRCLCGECQVKCRAAAEAEAELAFEPPGPLQETGPLLLLWLSVKASRVSIRQRSGRAKAASCYIDGPDLLPSLSVFLFLQA